MSWEEQKHDLYLYESTDLFIIKNNQKIVLYDVTDLF